MSKQLEQRMARLEARVDQVMNLLTAKNSALAAPARLTVVGKLTQKLKRGSMSAPQSAEFTVWRRNAETFEWSSAGWNDTVVDIGIIPSALRELAVNSIVVGSMLDNGLVLTAYGEFPEDPDDGEIILVGRLLEPLSRGTLLVPKRALYRVYDRDINDANLLSPWTATARTRFVYDLGLVPKSKNPIKIDTLVVANHKSKIDLLQGFDCDQEAGVA